MFAGKLFEKMGQMEKGKLPKWKWGRSSIQQGGMFSDVMTYLL
jgi:hypothetical protein